jgi:tetratricopeptide (TPR) repeat protein
MIKSDCKHLAYNKVSAGIGIKGASRHRDHPVNKSNEEIRAWQPTTSNQPAGKDQLATVQMYQEEYAEAVAGHEAARIIFERLNEPKSIATAWHQIGSLHVEAGRYDEARTEIRRAIECKRQFGHAASPWPPSLFCTTSRQRMITLPPPRRFRP